ncbi:cysteine-rich small domain-containing protein [Clostridium sp. DL1XJH146]
MDHYKFNQNKKCEYFPCHKGVDEDKFNCLFCYCPLYMLGDECGGNYKITNDMKDCSQCTKPHDEEGYEYIMSKMKLVLEKGSYFIKGY